MEFTSLLNTSLDLNYNPQRILDEPDFQKQEVNTSFIHLGRNHTATVTEERGALMEELSRESAENKKRKEMLTATSENYTELRNQLIKNTNNNTSKMLDSNTAASRKMNIEPTINNNSNIHSESSSSDKHSSKKPREELVKAKISRVQIRTEASHTSLIVKDGYQWIEIHVKFLRVKLGE